jgi:hypothetical protein
MPPRHDTSTNTRKPKHHCRRTAQERLPRDRFQAQQAAKVVEQAFEKILSSPESTVVTTSHSLARNCKRHCTH